MARETGSDLTGSNRSTIEYLLSNIVDTSAVVLISHYGAHVLPVQPERSVMPQLISFIASGYLFKDLIQGYTTNV